MSAISNDPTASADPGRAPASAQAVALFAMATLAERRDADTESHLLRMQGYLQVLAEALQKDAVLAPVLNGDYISHLVQCVLVYDIGTLAIPERILLKPGRYNAEERGIMQSHTVRGFQALERAAQTCGGADSWLQMAKEMTLSHHEHWDGQGYPQQLAGTAIPLSARILAVADAYDAMITHKVYKAGVTHPQAVAQISAQRGFQFDPQVVDAFLERAPDIEQLAQRHADSEDDLQRKMDTLAESIAEHVLM
jgi:putative two-component system response regulator